MKQNIAPRSKFAALRERWIKLIAENKNMSRGDIIIKLGLTPQQYYLNASVIEETAKGLLKYEKESKTWEWIGGSLIEKPIVKETEVLNEDEEIKDPEWEGVKDEGREIIQRDD